MAMLIAREARASSPVRVGLLGENYVRCNAVANAGVAGTTSLLLGMVAFSLQIYGDFSGYSDIARGTARLFGVELRVVGRPPVPPPPPARAWRR